MLRKKCTFYAWKKNKLSWRKTARFNKSKIENCWINIQMPARMMRTGYLVSWCIAGIISWNRELDWWISFMSSCILRIRLMSSFSMILADLRHCISGRHYPSGMYLKGKTFEDFRGKLIPASHNKYYIKTCETILDAVDGDKVKNIKCSM